MKGTVLTWLGVVAVAIGAALVCRWFGFDSNWVATIATIVAAIAALVGPLREWLPRHKGDDGRRAAHLEQIVTNVLEPILQELEGHYAAVTSRTTYLVEWIHGVGLQIKNPHLQSALFHTSPPTPINGSLAETLYEDVKEHHYSMLMTRYETFKRDYESFVQSTLEQAKKLELELHAVCTLPALDTDRESERGCYFGSLANYVFNRVWLIGYDSPLAVELDSTRANARLWRLMNVGSQMQYGRGTEDEMRALQNCAETLIAHQNRDQFTKAAVVMFERLKKLQRELARIQVNGTLEGECLATKSAT